MKLEYINTKERKGLHVDVSEGEALFLFLISTFLFVGAGIVLLFLLK